MLWFLLFILGVVCVPIAVISLAVWLAAATVQRLLTCAEKALASFVDGRAIVALLYLVQ
jgi:hypothetical protein